MCSHFTTDLYADVAGKVYRMFMSFVDCEQTLRLAKESSTFIVESSYKDCLTKETGSILIQQ